MQELDIAPSIDTLVQQTEDNGYELIDGKLVEKPMGAEASRTAVRVAYFLMSFVLPRQLGEVFEGECGYQIFPSQPTRVRKPDVSYIARVRLPGQRVPRGNMRISPDLVAEIVSPNDLAEEVELRIADYLSANVGLIWILYPQTRSVWTFSTSGTARLASLDRLTGGTVLPDFSVAVADLFPEPDPGSETSAVEPVS
jgi:Uma2 family endonuclease